MRVKLDRPLGSNLAKAPPSAVHELCFARRDRQTVGPSEHEPETHVDVSLGSSLGLRDRDHERTRTDRTMERGLESELLADLPDRGAGGVFVDFDVTASWEPSLSVTVVDQEDLSGVAVDKHGVRDKVLRRSCRLRRPEDLIVPSELVL